MIKKDNVIWRAVDKEALLLDTDTGDYYSLNATGSLIWSLLNEGLSTEEIAKRIAAKFKLDSEVARVDVVAFISNLRDSGLVEG